MEKAEGNGSVFYHGLDAGISSGLRHCIQPVHEDSNQYTEAGNTAVSGNDRKTVNENASYAEYLLSGCRSDICDTSCGYVSGLVLLSASSGREWSGRQLEF